MLKLKDVYALPYKLLNLSDWCLRECWFPEIEDVLSNNLRSEALAVLQSEGRIQVRELVNDYIDGRRVLEMMTVWFDGEPVLIVQVAGREGRDHYKRWVTDAPRCLELMSYLLSKLVQEERRDLADPESEVYVEEIFNIYGTDVSERFGYKPAPRIPGYSFLGESYRMVPGADRDLLLFMVSSAIKEPAAFVRRQAFVMRFVRALTDAELATNERLALTLTGSGYDRYVWYKPAERPADPTTVLSI